MQINHQKITPCLWFESEAEEAARFYTSIFENSKIGKITRYAKEGYEIHGRPEGSVMTVEFDIAGQTFTALNGGPIFKFNEAISFQLHCETPEKSTTIRSSPLLTLLRASYIEHDELRHVCLQVSAEPHIRTSASSSL